MPIDEPPLTLGIEEEYLLVDAASLDLVEAPEEFMTRCRERLGDQVSPEFLKCQIEVGTGVCADVAAARADLRRLRSTVSEEAGKFGLAPIAASCHPFADWHDQQHTQKQRYDELERALAGVARRMLISGMHIHVGVDDRDLRVDLMNQMAYFLPHLLGLSANSPFWQGRDTGLASYRVAVFDNMPRTGPPPQFSSWTEYERTTGLLQELDLIEDTTKIWWDLRPSASFPTLETRICDLPARLEHVLTLTAINQCLVRMLSRLARRNQRWRVYDRFLLAENRWRAQRYGTDEGLIDFGARAIMPFDALVEELIELLEEDAGVLQCAAELEGARHIIETGNGATRQRRVFDEARAAGKTEEEALCAIVQDLVEAFHEDL